MAENHCRTKKWLASHIIAGTQTPAKSHNKEAKSLYKAAKSHLIKMPGQVTPRQTTKAARVI